MPLKTTPLLEYVERVRSEGSPARFPPSTWNVLLQTLRKDHRTNNLCERWNNKFARLVGHSHPTTWNCIVVLQKDEICSRRTIIQFEIGEEEPRQHSAVYSYVNARLQHLCIRYRNRKNRGCIFYDFAPTATVSVTKQWFFQPFFEFQWNQYSKLTNNFFILVAHKLGALSVNKNFPVQPLSLIILLFGFEESYSAGRPLSRTHQLFHPESILPIPRQLVV